MCQICSMSCARYPRGCQGTRSYRPRCCNKYSGKGSHHPTTRLVISKGLSRCSGKGSLFSLFIFWKQPGTGKQQPRCGALASVQRPEEPGPLPLLFFQPVLVGNPLLPRIKARGKKLSEGQVQRGWTIRRDFHQSVSGGTSSESVFPFPFGSLPVHGEPERFLVQTVASPCHLAGCTHMGGKWCYLSGSKRIIYRNSFVGKKRGKRKVQVRHFVQMARAGARYR